MMINPNIKIQNTKQIPNPNVPMFKTTGVSRFEIGILIIGACLGFRIWCSGFAQGSELRFRFQPGDKYFLVSVTDQKTIRYADENEPFDSAQGGERAKRVEPVPKSKGSGSDIMSRDKIVLEDYIRDVPDWPKKGILFRDITPLLAEPKAFRAAVDALAADYVGAGIQYVAAVEARGFIFGSAVAAKLNAGFVPIRKKGKLPFKTESITYDLEYGTDTLQVHSDAVTAGAKVLMVDDLLATGGTMAAACKLVEKIGGRIAGIVFLVELTDLHGIDKLTGYKVKSVIRY
jgi:adenine phosphoribosyltransferase